MRIRCFALAVRELIRDFHVTYHYADRGFAFALVKSAISILL
jgi:hypothetical protein